MAQAETWGRKIYWYAFHLLTNLSLRRSSYAITTAHFLPDDYPGGAALRRKRRVFHAPPGAPQPPADLQKDPNLVVAVGNIVRHKKYEVLVRAIALVVQRRPETRLAIIGRAADVRAKKELGRAIQETGLQDRVELTGFIPDKEVFLRLQQASVLVSTSAAEAANMVVIEAMRLGTPVILGDLRGQRELAHGVGVLLPSDGDPVKAYAEAILQLLNDAELQRVMAAAGRQQAKLFDWSNTASTILDVLRRSVRSDTACKA